MVRGQAAPDISPADHNRGLDAERLDFLDPLGDLADDLRRNILLRPALTQSFAAQLQDDAFVDRRWRFAWHGRQ